jgi:hypothetical protein
MKQKRKRFSKIFKTKIYERDNYECQRCSKNLFNDAKNRVIDHKIPLSKGGGNSESNLWLLCNDCDKKKKDTLCIDLLQEYVKGKLISISRKINGKNNYKK